MPRRFCRECCLDRRFQNAELSCRVRGAEKPRGYGLSVLADDHAVPPLSRLVEPLTEVLPEVDSAGFRDHGAYLLLVILIIMTSREKSATCIAFDRQKVAYATSKLKAPFRVNPRIPPPARNCKKDFGRHRRCPPARSASSTCSVSSWPVETLRLRANRGGPIRHPAPTRRCAARV